MVGKFNESENVTRFVHLELRRESPINSVKSVKQSSR